MNTESVQSMALVLHRFGDNVATVVHKIHADPSGRLVMGAGRPLTSKDERGVIEILSSKKSIKRGFLPGNVLACDPGLLVWYRPPQLTTLNMDGIYAAARTPTLIFRVEENRLQVAAMKSAARPTPGTKIFHSGLPNTDRLGRWCSGGNAVPSQPVPHDIVKIERMFFESPFTHHGASPLHDDAGDTWDFWQHDSRRKSFPTKLLLNMQDRHTVLTVADFIAGECHE